VDQSSPDYVSRRERDRSLQRCFPIVDVSFHSGDIRDRSAMSSEMAPESMFFGPNFFRGGGGGGSPNFGPSFHFRYVAKFRGDRPRDRRDLALNKKEKKKKQQQNIRAAVALSQRAALVSSAEVANE